MKMKIDASGKTFTSQIGVKAGKKNGKTTISGLANAFTVDRANEIIETDAWTLDDFKKNPVILVEHSFHPMFAGLPVGKATQIQQTDGGLAFTAEISQSKTEPITMIRDLVDEGLLKAVSVGFDPKRDEEVEGVKRIKEANLFEISLVGIPMNQDSLVDVKSFSKSDEGKSLWYNLNTLRMEICKSKKAVFAAEIHRRIRFLQDETSVDRARIFEDIAKESGCSVDDLKPVLAGDTSPTEVMIRSMADILVMDYKALKGVAKADSVYKRDQRRRIKQKEDEIRKQDFQECVQAKIPKLIDEGMDQEQAVAVAISRCQEAGKRVALSADEYDELIALAGSLKQAEQDNVQPETTPVDNSVESVKTDNPVIDLMKQNNVLLGSLINEVQILNATMAPQVKQDDDEQDDESEEPEEEPEEEKASEDSPDDEEDDDDVKFFADRVNNLWDIRKDNVSETYTEFVDNKGYEIYTREESQSKVYNNILDACFKHGFTGYRENEYLDRLLSEKNKDHIRKLKDDREKSETNERLDNVRKRLENYGERLKRLGTGL